MAPALSARSNFTSGPIAWPLLRFTVPLFLGSLLQQMYNIADSAIIGRLVGSEALAAVGVTFPITHLITSIATGLTLGTGVVTAQIYGAGKKEAMQTLVSTCLLFFIAIGLAVSILGCIFTPAILRICNAPSAITPLAGRYLRIIFVGMLFVVVNLVAAALLRGLGNSTYALYSLIVSTILNITLDIICVGVFGWGVEGAAWATVASQVIACLVILGALGKVQEGAYSSWKFSSRLLGDTLKIGIPSSLKSSAYWIGNIVLMSLVGSFGLAAVAGYSIGSKIDAFIQTPIIALSQALSTYVGQNIGSGDEKRVKKGVWYAQGFGLGFALVMTALVRVTGVRLPMLFSTDADVVAIAFRYLQIVTAFYVVLALQEGVQGMALGAGNSVILLCSTICAMWVVRIPLAYYLTPRFGMDGLWFSMTSGWWVALTFCNGYFLSGVWKKKLGKVSL